MSKSDKKLMNKSIFISPSSGFADSEKNVSIKNPAKMKAPTVKMPKPKKLPDSTDKPSVFFKSEAEEFKYVKHPTLAKLKNFLLKKHKK